MSHRLITLCLSSLVVLVVGCDDGLDLASIDPCPGAQAPPGGAIACRDHADCRGVDGFEPFCRPRSVLGTPGPVRDRRSGALIAPGTDRLAS